jgi:hypothetical protein
MKKIYVPVIALIFFSCMLLSIASCKKDGFLGATNTTNLTQSTIFTDSANTVGFLANIYTSVGFSVSPSRFIFEPLSLNTPCGGLDAACDESETSHTFSTSALAFATGSVNAGNVTDDAYKTCYTQIRAVNQLFKNISKSPIKSANQAQMLAEARFLRAWYYFILLEHYGGVPIVGNAIYNYTQPIPAKRSTFDQCVTYIASQCDSAYAVLPINQTGQNYGRASGGACLALKARLYLYAASPLYNKPPGMSAVIAPSDIASAAVKPLVGYPSYDPNRWVLAKNAAYAVISTGQYSLFTDSTNINGYGGEGAFQYLFTIRGVNSAGAVNNEYIFQYMMGANDYLESLFDPPSRTGANGAFPYQGMVDAFPMSNGKAITDPTSGYDPNNPYVNRDPRLRYSIIYDQNLLGNRTSNGIIDGYSPVNIYLNVVNGAKSGGTDAVYQGTPTGYYNNKMLDPLAVSGGSSALTNRVLPLMRYSEILLDYAEAANEISGPTDTVYNLVNQIRHRAGLSPYALPTGLSQSQMRTAIQNERRIELAYEGHRFFDVRRWLIADQTENFEGQGMEVDRTGSAVTYTEFAVRKHSFTTRMYLWPFPQTEIGKGSGLIQNPGY